eukprot:TRINITY_DN476_c2_g1_i1.p1 TRINITY_DN476_c2_g1~~TRINITY_DN476_c2_g1_i1.p1  ORF type:complete len:225 (+),score=78.18 TRINITY_DN476_c2_g1_i1:139-813(+)
MSIVIEPSFLNIEKYANKFNKTFAIINKSEKVIIFKIFTNSPSNIGVKPNFGQIEAGQEATISVNGVASEDLKAKLRVCWTIQEQKLNQSEIINLSKKPANEIVSWSKKTVVCKIFAVSSGNNDNTSSNVDNSNDTINSKQISPPSSLRTDNLSTISTSNSPGSNSSNSISNVNSRNIGNEVPTEAVTFVIDNLKTEQSITFRDIFIFFLGVLTAIICQSYFSK